MQIRKKNVGRQKFVEFTSNMQIGKKREQTEVGGVSGQVKIEAPLGKPTEDLHPRPMF